MLLILGDVEKRIKYCALQKKIYLKYLTSDCDARKKL